MPVSVSVIPESGIAVARFAGTPTLDELTQVLRRIYSDGSYKFSALWDFRDCAAGMIGRRELMEFASRVEQERPDVPIGRAAVVVDSDLNYGIVRMAQAYLDALPIELRLFREVDAALLWAASGPQEKN